MDDNNNVNTAADTLCYRLRQAREMLGINRSEFARRIGVKPSAAIQWEQPNGTHPATAHLIQSAIVTNVSLDWLATGRGHARLSQDTVNSESFAMNLFEETLLKLGRALPESAKAPLIALLASFRSI